MSRGSGGIIQSQRCLRLGYAYLVEDGVKGMRRNDAWWRLWRDEIEGRG